MSVTDKHVVVLVPISQLLPGDSPRLSGESLEHATALAESGAVLPPVVVHRTTMRVVDGMHRIRAALLRGLRAVEVRYFDGAEVEAFAFVVEANTKHGLPAKTVGAIRGRPTGESAQLVSRAGRDGRARTRPNC